MLRTHFIFAVIMITVATSGVHAQQPGSPGPVPPNTAAFEQDGVRVVSSLHAQVYEWTVTNVSAPPIMRFSIPEQNTYNQNIPPGWRMQSHRGVFTAFTEDERMAIHPGQTRTFDARTGSAGSMLGPAPLTLGFSADGNDIIIQNVWAPLPKRRSIVVAVAVTLMLIGLLHVAALRRNERRAKA